MKNKLLGQKHNYWTFLSFCVSVYVFELFQLLYDFSAFPRHEPEDDREK